MDYSATLVVDDPSTAVVDAFEDAIDRLPESAIVGGIATGWVHLAFTVEASNVLEALQTAASDLKGLDLSLPDNVRLRVERLGESESASVGADMIRRP